MTRSAFACRQCGRVLGHIRPSGTLRYDPDVPVRHHLVAVVSHIRPIISACYLSMIHLAENLQMKDWWCGDNSIGQDSYGQNLAP
jgi:hypothetical protein